MCERISFILFEPTKYCDVPKTLPKPAIHFHLQCAGNSVTVSNPYNETGCRQGVDTPCILMARELVAED